MRVASSALLLILASCHPREPRRGALRSTPGTTIDVAAEADASTTPAAEPRDELEPAEHDTDWAAGIALEDEGYALLDRGDAAGALSRFEASCRTRAVCDHARVGAALALRALGRDARASWLLDRTRTQIEARRGEPLRLEEKTTQPQVASILASPVGARWVTLSSEHVAVLHGTSLRELARFDVPKHVGPRRFKGHYVCVDSCSAGASSPDGRLFVWARATLSIHLVDLAAGTAPVVLGDDAGMFPMRVEFTPDGKTFAVNVADGVAIYDVATRTRTRVVPGGAPFAFTEGRTILATTRGLFDVETGREVGGLKLANGESASAISRDGRWVLAEREGNVSKPTQRFFSYFGVRGGWRDPIPIPVPGRLFRAAISPDSRFLATTPVAKTASLWDLSTMKEVRSWTTEMSYEGIGFTPDGRWLATWGSPLHVMLLDVSGKEPSRLLSAGDASPKGWIDTVAFSRDGARAMARAASPDALVVWDVGSARLTGVWRDKETRPACVAGNERYPAELCAPRAR